MSLAKSIANEAVSKMLLKRMEEKYKPSVKPHMLSLSNNTQASSQADENMFSWAPLSQRNYGFTSPKGNNKIDSSSFSIPDYSGIVKGAHEYLGHP